MSASEPTSSIFLTDSSEEIKQKVCVGVWGGGGGPEWELGCPKWSHDIVLIDGSVIVVDFTTDPQACLLWRQKNR